MEQHPGTENRRILCPFYKGESALEIRCEAPFEEADVRLLFTKRAEKAIQKHAFCEEHYRRCEIYRCVKYNRYYEQVND